MISKKIILYFSIIFLVLVIAMPLIYKLSIYSRTQRVCKEATRALLHETNINEVKNSLLIANKWLDKNYSIDNSWPYSIGNVFNNLNRKNDYFIEKTSYNIRLYYIALLLNDDSLANIAYNEAYCFCSKFSSAPEITMYSILKNYVLEHRKKQKMWTANEANYIESFEKHSPKDYLWLWGQKGKPKGLEGNRRG
jgi:hypothetical protein